MVLENKNIELLIENHNYWSYNCYNPPESSRLVSFYKESDT